MAELRWHPLTQDWVMIASHRQARPQMPKDWCPFCPGSGKVPDDYEVYEYDNDFPALSPLSRTMYRTSFSKPHLLMANARSSSTRRAILPLCPN